MMMPQAMTPFLFCLCLAVLADVTEGETLRGVKRNVRATKPRKLEKKKKGCKETKTCPKGTPTEEHVLEHEVKELEDELKDLKGEVVLLENGNEEDEMHEDEKKDIEETVPIFPAKGPRAPPTPPKTGSLFDKKNAVPAMNVDVNEENEMLWEELKEKENEALKAKGQDPYAPKPFPAMNVQDEKKGEKDDVKEENEMLWEELNEKKKENEALKAKGQDPDKGKKDDSSS